MGGVFRSAGPSQGEYTSPSFQPFPFPSIPPYPRSLFIDSFRLFPSPSLLPIYPALFIYLLPHTSFLKPRLTLFSLSQVNLKKSGDLDFSRLFPPPILFFLLF